jgi:thiol-disulfide isomerase/thioredoxin
MRRVLALTALATSLFAAQIPRKASELVIQMADGQPLLLSRYFGKTIVLALMSNTCIHCRDVAQVLTQIQKEYAAKGVQVLGVTFEPGAAFRVPQFSRSLGLNFPCGYSSPGPLLDFVQLRPDQPYYAPMLVFIDRRRYIRFQHIHDEKFLARPARNIRAEIEKLL